MNIDDRFHAYPMTDRLALCLSPRRERLAHLEAMAMERLRSFIATHRTSLALSFGKDSMTLLHLLYRANLLERLVMVMWNACGMDTPDTLAMRDYVVERYSLGDLYVETVPDEETLERTLHMVDVSAHHPTRDFVYECLEQPRWRALDEREVDGVILGVRGDESKGRAMHVAMRGPEYWSRREKADILMPIARWATEDVFRYAAWRDVPLHPIYHRAPALGFPRKYVRLASPVDLTAGTRGGITLLKRLYPDTYRRYVSLAPDVTTLA